GSATLGRAGSGTDGGRVAEHARRECVQLRRAAREGAGADGGGGAVSGRARGTRERGRGHVLPRACTHRGGGAAGRGPRPAPYTGAGSGAGGHRLNAWRTAEKRGGPVLQRDRPAFFARRIVRLSIPPRRATTPRA